MHHSGSIKLKNWKSMSLDAITDDPSATVDNILGDMSSLATLKIRLRRYIFVFVFTIFCINRGVEIIIL